MKRYLQLVLLVLFSQWTSAQVVYRTQPLSDDIKTLIVMANNDFLAPPVVNMLQNEEIVVKFDKLSIDEPRLRYRVVHCNADWTPSDVSDVEYLSGFNNQIIDDYRYSENTTVNYIHYQLKFPNNDMQLKLSGNYVVEVVEDSNPDYLLLTACFSVLDPKVHIRSAVTGNTDIDFNREHQQLSFEISHPQLNLYNPKEELQVLVRQNNRVDNERQNIQPTYIQLNKLVYDHNRALIFEAGNEYRRFETVSRYYNGLNVYSTFYEAPYMQAPLLLDAFRSKKVRQYDKDQNGRFFIRNADEYDSDVQSDYFMVHFSLAAQPMGGDIFLNGDFTYNTFSDWFRMEYDAQTNEYFASVLLKQGAYNYQYLSPGLNGFSTEMVEGNYFDTENEYLILVYYRAPGRRYDQLVGMHQARMGTM